MTRRLMVFGPALIAVGSGVLAFAALRAELTTRRAVIHTRDVLETSSSLLTALVEAEAAQRGFIITRDTAFLAPDYPLKTRSDSVIAALRSLLRDNPSSNFASTRSRTWPDSVSSISIAPLPRCDPASPIVPWRLLRRGRAVVSWATFVA